jgi:hypothetical protein
MALQKMTDEIDKVLLTSNRELIDSIVNQLKRSPAFAKHSIQILKKKLVIRNNTVQLNVLSLVDKLMDECGLPVHQQVGGKDFMNSYVHVVCSKDLNKELTDKMLYLIKKWANKFENQKDIMPNFNESYI